ncbi:MAG: hypothetical protein HY921_07515 [Elusimicrobia bacterium]|nr:hypothetical protein [Elusimicrobiota bacterium]
MMFPSCLDCSWCALRAGSYGSVGYWCRVTRKGVLSALVGRQSCPRFARLGRKSTDN